MIFCCHLCLGEGGPGQCHENFGIFLFHELKPSGLLISRLKWFCLKFRSRGSRKIRLRAVLACAESDSWQANTARSQKLKYSQIQNWLTLRGVKQFFLIFKNLHFQGIKDPYDDISKNFEYFLKIQK